jgi:hypothetical protein
MMQAATPRQNMPGGGCQDAGIFRAYGTRTFQTFTFALPVAIRLIMRVA